MSSGQRGGGGGLVWMAGTLGRASVARDSDEVDCPAHAVGSPGHAELPRTSSEAEGRPGPASERGAAGPPTLSRRQNRMPGPQSAWGPRDGSPGTTNHGGRGIDAKRMCAVSEVFAVYARLYWRHALGAAMPFDARLPYLAAYWLGGLHGAGAAPSLASGPRFRLPRHQWRDFRFRACNDVLDADGAVSPFRSCIASGGDAPEPRRGSRRWRSRHRTTCMDSEGRGPHPSGSCSRTSPSAGCGPRPLRWLQD